MSFLAACDRPDADRYEKHIVRLARHWLRMIDSPRTTQISVDRLLDEFREDHEADYGMQWGRLRRDIVAWARKEGWLEEGDARLKAF